MRANDVISYCLHPPSYTDMSVAFNNYLLSFFPTNDVHASLHHQSFVHSPVLKSTFPISESLPPQADIAEMWFV